MSTETRIFEKNDDFNHGKVSTKYALTILLEIIRSEGPEGLWGFPYLAKKCYLVEKIRSLNLFGFHLDEIGCVTSSFLDGRIRVIEWFNLARVTRDDTIRKETENFCGELCQEHLALCDEQVEYRYLDRVRIANNPDFKRWQETIDMVNKYPNGKNWHIVSVATHLHAHGRSSVDQGIIIEDIKNRARDRNVSLPKNVFDDATLLLNNLNLTHE